MRYTLPQLLNILAGLGCKEGEDFEVTANGYTSDVIFRADIPNDSLPEVLQPFAPSEYEVERALYKGYGGGKRTANGKRFHMAFQDYAHSVLAQRPEIAELEKTLETVKTLEEFNSYSDARRAVWDRLMSEPEMVELSEKLETYL